MNWERTANPGCQEGLSYTYHLGHPVSADRIIFALQATYLGSLSVIEEPLGSRLCHRVLLKRRFEFRLGQREKEIVLIHRISASDTLKIKDRGNLESVLDGLK